ncbi:MAG: cell wall-binding repeat-containing protein, partial [Methanopyri archaeon]|nr:cell wall-binding repeat-containing protein [Methanopyri archaeon]
MGESKALLILFTTMVLVVVLCTSLPEGGLDAVILATSRNYPDAIIAGAGSDKAGIPVLLTPPDVLPGKVADFLNETRPERIILVGGSAVISTDIEGSLTADGFEVVRTWGVSRYGTAAEFATYMWQEGAEEAVLVYDVMGDAEGFEHIQLAMAKGLAAARKVPVLLTAGDALSAETSNALKELGVTKVLLVGTRFADNVTVELKTLGIEIDIITGKDENEVIKKLEDRAIKELREEVAVDNLVVIATAANDFLSTISMPNTVEVSARKVISDESEIG